MSQSSEQPRTFVAVLLDEVGGNLGWSNGEAIFTLEATTTQEAQEIAQKTTGNPNVLAVSLASWKHECGEPECPPMERWSPR